MSTKDLNQRDMETLQHITRLADVARYALNTAEYAASEWLNEAQGRDALWSKRYNALCRFGFVNVVMPKKGQPSLQVSRND